MFDGGVEAASGGVNGIELLAGASAGSLTAIGSKYAGFNSISIASGAAWTIAGPLSQLDTVTVSGLTSADTIDLTGLAYIAGETARVNPAGDVLALYGPTRNTGLGALQLAGPVSVLQFAVGSDGAGGTLLSERPAATGTLVGSNTGILLSAGAMYGPVVTVAYTAYAGNLIGTTYGIEAQNEKATITNFGRVSGASYGIELSQGGTVANGSSASQYVGAPGIYGYADAVTFGANRGVLTNFAGEIGEAKIGAAVYAGNGGWVENNAGATLSGAYGIELVGAAGTVLNSGLIRGGMLGIELGAGGSVSNSGTILGANYDTNGVDIEGAMGMLVNRGDILMGKDSLFGVRVQNGGNVYNAGGTITSARYGVEALFGGTLDNFGGLITGFAIGGTATITNSYGTISAGYKFGVDFGENYGVPSSLQLTNNLDDVIQGITTANGATIDDASSATIDGYGIAVFEISRLSATFSLTNSGLVQGAEFAGAIASGVSLTGLGTASITNESGGTITTAPGLHGVPGYGIVDNAGFATIANAGAIYGLTDGVLLTAGGSVVNSASATIVGGKLGVFIGGATASLENGGTITGLHGAAVSLEGTVANLLTLDAGGVFHGAINVDSKASDTLVLGTAGGGRHADRPRHDLRRVQEPRVRHWRGVDR